MALLLAGTAMAVDQKAFEQPLAGDRPWVYWFWKNGNISRDGITADLEALNRVGIGGVIMMEVALSVPPGKTPFFSLEWHELFKHAVSEANRLGLAVTINTAPGWTGSGGPWVTPEQSMQQVVFSETTVSGPAAFAAPLPEPERVQEFYKDIAVLAFPTVKNDRRIKNVREKALYTRGPFSSKPDVPPSLPMSAIYETLPADAAIARQSIVDITSKMSTDGKLVWNVPVGDWTIQRIGHTSTGQTNRPAPLPGLECDKMDLTAVDAHFESYITKLLDEVDPDARKAVVATHLDSWEVGAQNWTEGFRAAFAARRGYDPLPFLPVMSGRVVDSVEISERFLWDLRQTVSELIVENHGKRLAELAKQHGLWFSVEPYDMTPCDDMSLGATADVPMCEFWSKGFDTRYSVKEASSVAHTYGKKVVGAEAFTSVDRWLFHPATLKAQGDWAYGEGVNRFVIHRYIHQPFPQARPGLSLGPHGVHYERTQTWWEYSKPWHEYLARCQYMLRQGRFVSDILYLNPEGAPNVFQSPAPAPAWFKFDACTPDALLHRISVTDGKLTMPDGAQYRLLVLPFLDTMTPDLLARVLELVDAGATVVGAPPSKSPSLSGYPACDDRVRDLVNTLWGAVGADAAAVERGVGKGHLVSIGKPPVADPQRLIDEELKTAHWIWQGEPGGGTPSALGKRYFRRVLSLENASDIDSAEISMTADNAFRLYVNGEQVLRGDTFEYLYSADVTRLLTAGENIFAVAAENGGDQPNPAGLLGTLTLRRKDGRTETISTDNQWSAASAVSNTWLKETGAEGWKSAFDIGPYGTPPWAPIRRSGLRGAVYPDSALVEAQLAKMNVLPDFESDHPLNWAHRTDGNTDIYFVANGTAELVDAVCQFRAGGKTPKLWHPESGKVRALSAPTVGADGRIRMSLRFEPTESYFVVFDPGAAPTTSSAPDFPTYETIAELPGPWSVAFDPASGGPDESLRFDTLEDWSKRTEEGVRYYSGTAVYRSTFLLPNVPSTPQFLDLGRVEVVASVEINGKQAGTVWKAPFRLEVSGLLRAGENALVVRVANLWPNRLIGDELLPTDTDRNPNGTVKAWPDWLLQGQPSPTGRHTFATWRHWTKDDTLLPSGMLGPVTLLVEQGLLR